jgi:hypothetical protein
VWVRGTCGEGGGWGLGAVTTQASCGKGEGMVK